MPRTKRQSRIVTIRAGQCVWFLCLCLGVALCAALASPLFSQRPPAQDDYRPSKENRANRAWFQRARFGMFVHWGMYSVLGEGEWAMENNKLSVNEYEKLAPRFNPTAFNAAELVALAKAAGMQYLNITSKHHDGFAMWDSQVSDWTVTKRTPYKKDIIKLIADECRKQGLKLFLYHSQLDWHHPDYFPIGKSGGAHTGRPNSGDFNRYLNYLDAQLTELLTNYGPLAGIWLDGSWDKPNANWRLAQTYRLIHALQPGALIGSNHHMAPQGGEDFQVFERDLPGFNTFGFNTTEIGQLPLETADTINRDWGYNANDKDFKSTKTLIDLLVRAAGHNANFLLNVGPQPDGKIRAEEIIRLQQMGSWLNKYGESIYDTQGGPLSPSAWGVTTQRGNTVYVHLLNHPAATLELPHLTQKVISAKALKDSSRVEFSESTRGITLRIPPTARDEYATVIALELAP